VLQAASSAEQVAGGVLTTSPVLFLVEVEKGAAR
jgi:hypothetical protein